MISKSSLKVGFICSEYPPYRNGGIGTFVRDLSERLVSRKHYVVVIGLYDVPKTTIERLNGVILIRVRKHHLKYVGWILNRFVIFATIRYLFLKKKIDLVEDNDWEALTAFFPKSLIKRICRLHHGKIITLKSYKDLPFIKRTILLSVVTKSQLLVAVSNTLANAYCSIFKFPDDRIQVIYNGVQLEEFVSVAKRSKKTIIFVGTLSKNKGVLELVSALKLLATRLDNLVVRFVGKDSRYTNDLTIKQFVQNELSNLPVHVEFYGHVEKRKVLNLLSDSSIFVLPSHFEAFSLAPLESMASGCPTVFTKLTSGIETINDGFDGVLINPFDIVEFSEVLFRLLTDFDLANTLSINGYNSVRLNFNIDSKVLENEALYSKVLLM